MITTTPRRHGFGVVVFFYLTSRNFLLQLTIFTDTVKNLIKPISMTNFPIAMQPKIFLLHPPSQYKFQYKFPVKSLKVYQSITRVSMEPVTAVILCQQVLATGLDGFTFEHLLLYVSVLCPLAKYNIPPIYLCINLERSWIVHGINLKIEIEGSCRTFAGSAVLFLSLQFGLTDCATSWTK